MSCKTVLGNDALKGTRSVNFVQFSAGTYRQRSSFYVLGTYWNLKDSERFF